MEDGDHGFTTSPLTGQCGHVCGHGEEGLFAGPGDEVQVVVAELLTIVV
jgi:hypothetical protein